MRTKIETSLCLIPALMAAELDLAGNDTVKRKEIFAKYRDTFYRKNYVMRGTPSEKEIKTFVLYNRPRFKGIVKVTVNKLIITDTVNSETINKFTIEV